MLPPTPPSSAPRSGPDRLSRCHAFPVRGQTGMQFPPPAGTSSAGCGIRDAGRRRTHALSAGSYRGIRQESGAPWIKLTASVPARACTFDREEEQADQKHDGKAPCGEGKSRTGWDIDFFVNGEETDGNHVDGNRSRE